MNLLNKQLTQALLKNKILICLLFLLTCFTSFMYLFIHFSIDGNMGILKTLPSLTENETLYLNALNSNTSLASSFLLGSLILTGFVFFIFFYSFFKKNSKSLGTLKALGFKDKNLYSAFMSFAFMLSIIGGTIGLIFGYFASDILLSANTTSYQVSNLVKQISPMTFLIGLPFPAMLFSLVTRLAYATIEKQDIALLLTPTNDACTYSNLLGIANKIAQFYPGRNKQGFRLALRKPITLLLILTAVMTFSIMFILAYSLNLSSQKVYDSQTLGYHYDFDTAFNRPIQIETSNHKVPFSPIVKSSNISDMPYLNSSGTIHFDDYALAQEVLSFDYNSNLFSLMNEQEEIIDLPHSGQVIISPMLYELYGLKIGDSVTITLGNYSKDFTISAIAFNAQSNTVYIASSDLRALLKLPASTYTGLWSHEAPSQYLENPNIVTSSTDLNHFIVVTKEDRLQNLERNFVSNHTSATINQVMGCLAGCILLFLALFINFQDHTRDMLILNLMGYQPPAIRRMLVNLYHPIICIFFVVTLYPSIVIVKGILKSLSLQIGDYMPFQTTPLVLIGIFVLLNVIYLCVQLTFNLGIKRIIQADKVYEYTYNL